MKMIEKHLTWKDSGESISYEGSAAQVKELETLMSELPLIGDFPIKVRFSETTVGNRKKVYILPQKRFGGISCMLENCLDQDSPIKFVAMEKSAGYIELIYKDYNLWIQTFDTT